MQQMFIVFDVRFPPILIGISSFCALLFHIPQLFLISQLVKNPPAIRETWVQSLGWEDPLEKGPATHSSILAWRIPWTVQSWGRKESDTRGLSDFHFHSPTKISNVCYKASIEETTVQWELIIVINLLALLILNEAHSCSYSYLSTLYQLK